MTDVLAAPTTVEVAPRTYAFVQPDGTWFINSCWGSWSATTTWC